jgi:hypothetical protein
MRLPRRKHAEIMIQSIKEHCNLERPSIDFVREVVLGYIIKGFRKIPKYVKKPSLGRVLEDSFNSEGFLKDHFEDEVFYRKFFDSMTFDQFLEILYFRRT